MATFAYTGRTRAGQNVSGERSAESMDAAVAALRRDQILVTQINPVKEKAGKDAKPLKAKTVDLLVPAEAEVIIEGFISTEDLEPEAPFGESHGHISLEDFNMIFDVTCITHRKKPMFASIISSRSL